MAGADVANVDNTHERASGGGAVGAVDDRVTKPVGSARDDARDHVPGNRRGGAGAVAPIPGSIVKAICTVQASIDAVAKTQFNRQGNYKFASADDIYAAVARKFGDVGLMIYPLEMSAPEIKRVEKTDKDGELKVSQWGQFCFGYVLATEDATWFDPRSSRTIYIQILGPQTFNAAESYCQKQYLRALLKLPTGDMDLDSMPQAENEDDQVSLNGKRRPKSSAEGKRDGSVKVFNEILAKIKEAPNADVLQQIQTLYAEEWSTMPSRWAETLNEDYESRMTSFGSREAAE